MNQPLESIVVAMTRRRLIGAGGALPWQLPEELEHFRRLTWGGTLIMGRTTFAGIGRALPGRRSIVVSTTLDPPPGVTVVATFAEAVGAAQRLAAPIFYVGGIEIYRQALLRADLLEISWIKAAARGDRYFPPYAAECWCEELRQDHGPFVHVRYRRRPAPL